MPESEAVDDFPPELGGDPWDGLREEAESAARRRRAAVLRHRRVVRPGIEWTLALYGLSLVLPCASDMGPVGRGTVWGAQALFDGAAAIVGLPLLAAQGDPTIVLLIAVGYVPWIANVIGAVGLFNLWRSRFAAAATCGLAALVIGLFSFLGGALAGGDLLVGFYVWLASFAALAIAGWRGARWTGV